MHTNIKPFYKFGKFCRHITVLIAFTQVSLSDDGKSDYHITLLCESHGCPVLPGRVVHTCQCGDSVFCFMAHGAGMVTWIEVVSGVLVQTMRSHDPV